MPRCIMAKTKAILRASVSVRITSGKQKQHYVFQKPNLIQRTDYRQTLFYCTSLYCAWQMLHFLQIESLWQPCVQHVYGQHFSNSIYPLHASVSHFGNPHNISNYFIIIVSALVICNQRSLMLLLIFQGSHKAHSWETEHLSNKCYMPSPCSTSQASPVSPPLLWPPYDLRHNNTEMRTINSPLIASNFSGERVP